MARESLAVPDLTDDGDVGRHAEEAGDETAEVDLFSVLSWWARLHVRHVRNGDIRFKHFLGDDDPE